MKLISRYIPKSTSSSDVDSSSSSSDSANNNPSRIRVACAHPTQPWVACAESYRGTITIWDYERNVVSFQIGLDEISRRCQTVIQRGGNSSMSGAHMLSSVVASEKNMSTPSSNKQSLSSSNSGNNLYVHTATSSTTNISSRGKKNSTTLEKQNIVKLGSVRQIKFYDYDSLFWNMGTEFVDDTDIQEGFISPLSSYLIVVCKFRSVLVEIGVGRCFLLLDQSKQSKVCTIEPLNSSVLAVGYADGVLQFCNWKNGTKLGVKRAHPKEILQIIPAFATQNVISKKSSNARLITIGAEGNAVLWECMFHLDKETNLETIQAHPLAKMGFISVGDNVTTHASFDEQRSFFIALHSNLQQISVFDLSAFQSTTTNISSSSQGINLPSFMRLHVPSIGLGSLVVPAPHLLYSDTTLTCLVLNKSLNEVSYIAASVSSQESEVKPEEHAFCSVSALIGDTANKTKVYAICVPRFRCGIVVLASNSGLIIADNSMGRNRIVGTRHFAIGDNYFVAEGESVFKTQLDVKELNPVGHMRMNFPTITYKSVFPPETYAIRRPPRFIVSPTQSYVCLFWATERRYEIIHIPGLLANRGDLPPPIEFGSNVTDFAWIGSDNSFAILESSQEVVQVAKSKRIGKGLMNLKNRVSKFGQGNNVTAKANVCSKEVVHLKVLLESNVSARNKTAVVTAKKLGMLSTRGGLPVRLFSGPLLCVGCVNKNSVDTSDGTAYFYGKRISDDVLSAALYMSVGPALPIPDLVEWSEDGNLCCICKGKFVYIYVSKQPEFRLVSKHLLAVNEVGCCVQSAKFIHNVLFCTTRGTVQCIFVNNDFLSKNKSCGADSFVLSSFTSPDAPLQNFGGSKVISFSPPVKFMSLDCPDIVDIFAGSLLVSTSSGIQAVSLDHPILRIGILLSAGQLEKAKLWTSAVPIERHDLLSDFVERLGYPEVCVQLEGISLVTRINLCLKYKLTSSLEKIVNDFSVADVRKIKVGESNYSAIEFVGAYLLAHGNGELVRRMASESIVGGDESRREAFLLASLLLAVNSNDARRLIRRIIGSKNTAEDEWGGPVGQYMRNFVNSL